MAPWLQRVGKQLTPIMVATCMLAIAAIWLTTFQRIGFERSQAIAAAATSNSNLAIAFEQQVYRTLKAAEQVAAIVREQYLQAGPGIRLGEWVEQGIIRETMFTIISVVDEEGNVLASSQGVGPVNYADREFFRVHRDAMGDDMFVSPPVVGRVSAALRIPMSLRITRPDGSFGGVVVLSVEPDSFTDFYSSANLGRRGLLELTGLDGIVRARQIGPDDVHGLATREPLHTRLAPKEMDIGGIDDGSKMDGVARIVSHRSLADYPLVVTVGTAYDDELAPAHQRRSYYLLAAGVASIVLLSALGLIIVLLQRRRRSARALQASEALYRATFHQAATGIAHVAPDGRIMEANEKFHDMLGYRIGELRDSNLFELTRPDHRVAQQEFVAGCIANHAKGSLSEAENPYRHKHGSIVWVCEALGVVRNAHGAPQYLVAAMHDITARKMLEARLSHDAMHDALTGLPNRVLFQDRLERVLESARRHGRLAAVLYIDLDDFKPVNDRFGHAVGDRLLQQVAQRVKACVRNEDTAARFGGDEFGIVLTMVNGESDCQLVTAKIIDAISRPYELEGREIRISASVGAAVYPTHGDDAATLIARADSAMYGAKRAGEEQSECIN